MTDIRPLLLGYIRADALTTDREVARGTSELTAFADSEGYALATVFVERTDRAPAVFEALLAEVVRTGARAIVMPGPVLLACAQARLP
jgi:hypothetical protein